MAETGCGGPLTDCGGTTPWAAATAACETPPGAANSGAAGALTGGAEAVAGGDDTPAADMKDAGGTTGSTRENAAGDVDAGDVADPIDPADDIPLPSPEGDMPPPKPPTPPPPDNRDDPPDIPPPPKLGKLFRSGRGVGGAVDATAAGGTDKGRSPPKPAAAFTPSLTLSIPACPAGASGRPGPPKSSAVASGFDFVGMTHSPWFASDFAAEIG